MADPDLDALLGDHDERKMMRTGAEPTWQRINELIYPDGTPPYGNIVQGGPTRTEIFDNTGEDAADSASAFLNAAISNPATRWFELGLFDDILARDTYGGDWLYRTTSRMFASFRHASTLFNLASDEGYKQLVCIGNDCMHIGSRWGKLPIHRTMPMATICWDENEDGEIDTVDREFDLTARAALLKFGDALPPKIRRKAEARGQSLDMVKFLHVNAPRSKRDGKKLDRANMAYRSTYICMDEPAIVVDGGSHELEYVCTRLSRRANERYGRGFGHKALSDVEILQRMNRTVLLAGENQIEGPILAPDNGIVGPFTLRRRAINYVRAEYLSNGAAPRPYNTNNRVDIGLELIQDRRELVRRSFLKQLIEVIRDARATATHVLAIQEEQTRGLAPILGRLEAERLSRIVGRNYNILKRMPGIFDPAPPEIANQPITPSFQSPAAKAMRLGVARSIAQGFETMTPLFQMDPALRDNFELDESARTLADGMGFPASVMTPVEVRDRLRAQRQQIAMERQQIENAKDRSVVAKNLAPAGKVLADVAARAVDAQAQQPQPEAVAA